MDPHSLWVRDEGGKLLHVGTYHSYAAAVEEMHYQNSYAGGEGRVFSIYRMRRAGDTRRAEMVFRADTCNREASHA